MLALLANAQLGVEWGEKKSICNKFLQSNAGVTCITWPLEQVQSASYRRQML